MSDSVVTIKLQCGVDGRILWSFFAILGVAAAFFAVWLTSTWRWDNNDDHAEAWAWAVGASIHLIVAVISLIGALRRRREAGPQLVMDRNGILINCTRRDMISWADVESIESTVERVQGIYEKAELKLRLNTREVIRVDLLPFTGIHEKTIGAARQFLREDRRIDLHQVRAQGIELV